VIPVPSAVRVWLAVGHTDMRRGMNGLARQVQQALQHDPHAGDLDVFRGKRGDLVKILWHDGIGMSLYAKRLERGRFIWPTPTQGVVSISAAQLGYPPRSTSSRGAAPGPNGLRRSCKPSLASICRSSGSGAADRRDLWCRA
jgi:transposase